MADNEHLRDVLHVGDPKRPEHKIQFFVAVYQHLRERIRQDIIRTDDPVEAIQQMEIELSRLTEELTPPRELAISSRTVANIIRKTIQREQNRILCSTRVTERIVWSGEQRTSNVNACVKRTPCCWMCLNSTSSIRICLTATVRPSASRGEILSAS